MSETARLADQIRRAFEGDARYGESVLEILAGVDAKAAAARPIPNAHGIWELVLHISAWDKVVVRRAGGEAMTPSNKENFPTVTNTSEAAWHKALALLKDTHAELVKTVTAFPDSRLLEQVPGKKQAYYNFYYMFSGIVQHELYHAGQIALLKKL
jgi:uncharacterized damage-inducible protein DinB